MKKLCVILCIALLLSLLSGCSLDITGENSSIPLPDKLESSVNDSISNLPTDDSNSEASTTTQNANDESDTTSGNPSADTTTATTKKSEDSKSTTSATKKNNKTDKSTTKTTTSATTKNNVPQNPQPSQSLTSKTTSTTKPSHGTPNVQGRFHTDMAQAVLNSMNKARKEAGLNELRMDNGNMMTAAKIRAKEITVHWAHERPDGAKWDTVFTEEGVKYNMRGENLADGYETADLVFDGWMNSPGHRANIMEGRFTHVSIACFEMDGHFYWVQLFGATVTH